MPKLYSVFYNQRSEIKNGVVELEFDSLFLLSFFQQLSVKVKQIFGVDAELLSYIPPDGGLDE